MSYRVVFNKKSKKQLVIFEKSGNKQIVSKVTKLTDELREHPRTGTGKPEQLKYDLSDRWSRRITVEHRLVYKIEDEKVIVEVLSIYGHY